MNNKVKALTTIGIMTVCFTGNINANEVTTQNISNNTKNENPKTVDTTAPTAYIAYTCGTAENPGIYAVLTNPSEEITIINNGGSDRYLFKEDGEFTFEFIDNAGNIRRETAVASGIALTNPTFAHESEKEVFIAVGDNYEIPVVQAYDGNGNQINHKQVITNESGKVLSEIDTSQPGKYIITYTASDACGKTSVEKIEITIVAEIPSFVDTVGHWAEKEINTFALKGYVQGYENGEFKPENEVTRAEFVTMINNYFGLTQTSGVVFEDTKNHWAKEQIDIAITNGVANGFNTDEFRPNDKITREQVAVMIANYLNIGDTTYDKIDTYSDANNTSSWAKSSVEAILEKGYMYGYDASSFGAKNNITRAESVITLSRIVK